MPNPYAVLDATPEDDDDVIRTRYLEAVRRYPPERFPKEFRRVRDAFECIKDETSRLEFLLFEPCQGESIEELLVEERCKKSTKRLGLPALMKLLNEMT